MTGEIYMDVILTTRKGEQLEAQIEYKSQGVPTAVVYEGKVFMRTEYTYYVEVSSTDIVEAG